MTETVDNPMTLPDFEAPSKGERPDAYGEDAKIENHLRRNDVIAVECNHVGEIVVACDCGTFDHPDPHRRCLACGECFELETENDCDHETET